MKTKHLNGKGYFLDFLRDSGDTLGGIIVGAQFAWRVPDLGALLIGIGLIVVSIVLEKWDRTVEHNQETIYWKQRAEAAENKLKDNNKSNV